MQSLEKKLERILKQMSVVEDQYASLKKENQAIKEENLKLKSDIYSKTEEISVLRDRFDNFKRKNVAGNNTINVMDSEKMRTEIMHYIREVDKCLEWLSKF